MIKFIWNSGNAEKRQEGQTHMIYGVIGLAIMLSVYGIVTFILKTLNTVGTVKTPQTFESLQSSGVHPR